MSFADTLSRVLPSKAATVASRPKCLRDDPAWFGSHGEPETPRAQVPVNSLKEVSGPKILGGLVENSRPRVFQCHRNPDRVWYSKCSLAPRDVTRDLPRRSLRRHLTSSGFRNSRDQDRTPRSSEKPHSMRIHPDSRSEPNINKEDLCHKGLDPRSSHYQQPSSMKLHESVKTFYHS